MSEPAYPRPYGTWLLLERLGTGGMSEVDLARRAVTEGAFVRFVVIKRIRAGNQADELYIRMFQDEARITSELSHENIAQVYDFGREGDEFYMAMEYVPGLDLRAVQLALARKGKLIPVRVALTILVGVLRALQYAHARVDQLGRPMNIVHRDVNPRNVMLSVNGEVKLIDFGVAKAADRLEKTEGNAVKGKYAYMAPEQIEGNGELDGRADLYSVALMMHELLTGRSPFAGLSEVQILHRIVAGKVPPLKDGIDHPDLPLLRRIHDKGLAKDPDQRYRNADAFRLDLEAALAPIGGVAPPLWIAELLREANAEGVADISRRLKAWKDGAPSTPRGFVPRPPPAESSGTLNVASIEAVPRETGWLTIAAAGLGVSTLGVAGLLVIVLIGSAWWLWPKANVPSVSPEATAPAAGPTVIVPPNVDDRPGSTTGTVAAPPAAGAPTGNPATRPPATTPPADPGRPVGPTPVAPPVATTTATVTTLPDPTPPVADPTPPLTPPTTSVPPTPPTEAWTGTPTATPVVETSTGFVNLTSRPVKLDVYIDGKKVGTTPLRMYRVPVGTHEVIVRDTVTGRSDTRTVIVGANAVATPAAVILE